MPERSCWSRCQLSALRAFQWAFMRQEHGMDVLHQICNSRWTLKLYPLSLEVSQHLLPSHAQLCAHLLMPRAEQHDST